MELTPDSIQAKARATNLIYSSQMKGFENGHWWFCADTDPRGNAPQFQATNCLKCGNYILTNTIQLSTSIICHCIQHVVLNSFVDDYDDAYWQQVEDDWQRELDFQEGRRQYARNWSN